MAKRNEGSLERAVNGYMRVFDSYLGRGTFAGMSSSLAALLGNITGSEVLRSKAESLSELSLRQVKGTYTHFRGESLPSEVINYHGTTLGEPRGGFTIDPGLSVLRPSDLEPLHIAAGGSGSATPTSDMVIDVIDSREARVMLLKGNTSALPSGLKITKASKADASHDVHSEDNNPTSDPSAEGSHLPLTGEGAN